MEESIWNKELRIILFTSIYQNIFWEYFPTIPFYPDWENISEIFEKSLSSSNVDELNLLYSFFLLHKQDLINKLKLFLTSWDKTHLIIQSCLLCASVELSSKQTGSPDKVLAPYLRIADSFDSGSNVGVAHAVLSKVIESSGDYIHISLPKS